MSKFRSSIPAGIELAEGKSYVIVSVKRHDGTRIELAGIFDDSVAEEAMKVVQRSIGDGNDG